MPRLSNLTSFVVATFISAGCAITQQPRPEFPRGEPFVGVEAPPAGFARVYVFRPDFTDVLVEERPTLIVNGQERCLLAIGQYDSALLPPGQHRVSLAPGNGESDTWKSEYLLTLSPDSVSFLAIWNKVDSYFRSELALIPIKGAIFPMPMNVAGSKSVGVRYELVPQDEALTALAATHRALAAESSR